jgi:hypothetical protein
MFRNSSGIRSTDNALFVFCVESLLFLFSFDEESVLFGEYMCETSGTRLYSTKLYGLFRSSTIALDLSIE